MRSIADCIKATGRRVGIEVARYRPAGARRAERLKDYGIKVVIDVGANVGQYGRELRQFGYTGKIVSFEPLPSAFESLSRSSLNDPRWECYNIALGDVEEHADMNVAFNLSSSSFLAHRRDYAVPAELSFVHQERVAVTPLNSIKLPVEHPAMIKIDVQGFEDRVLKGASEVLSLAELIECELSIVHVYEGQPNFREMIDYLWSLGFALVDLEPGFYEATTGRILEVDAIFASAEPAPSPS